MQETQDVIEIDLKELFFVLVRRIPWLVLAAALGAGAAFLFTRLFLTPQYTSQVSLYVNNNTESGGAEAVNLNDLNASQKLVNTYIVILQNDEVLSQVAARLLEEYTAESLEQVLPFSDTGSGRTLAPAAIRDTLSMSAVNNTEVLLIESSTPSAELSARICTLLVEAAPEILQRVVKAGSVEVVGQAVPAREPSSPSLRRNLIIGFLIGGVLAAAIVVIRHLMDASIKDEEDFKKRFDIPALGEIPDFNSEKKGGYKAYAVSQTQE